MCALPVEVLISGDKKNHSICLQSMLNCSERNQHKRQTWTHDPNTKKKNNELICFFCPFSKWQTETRKTKTQADNNVVSKQQWQFVYIICFSFLFCFCRLFCWAFNINWLLFVCALAWLGSVWFDSFIYLFVCLYLFFPSRFFFFFFKHQIRNEWCDISNSV